ncbi:MAG: restriction endonuclease [bacterium]
MHIKNNYLQNISSIICNTFDEEVCPLCDWITKNIRSLSIELKNRLSEDDIFDNLVDEGNTNFITLHRLIQKRVNTLKPLNRIEVVEEIDGIKIKQTEIGSKTNKIIYTEFLELFSAIECWDNMEKGLFYENFCTKFLTDLGLIAETTPPSNDKGIDIIAKYKTLLEQEHSHLVFNDYIYMLGQAKFLKGKVDTPILRRLVGDSIFLRFDSLENIDIAHNAIHLIVFSHNGFTDEAIDFANKKKIMRVETNQLITLISSSKNITEMKCYKYIKAQITNHK